MISKAKRFLTRLNQTRTKFGSRAAAESVFDRVGQLMVGLQVVEVVWIEASQVSDLTDEDPRFTFRFLSADEIRDYAFDPDLKLDPQLAERVEAGQDLCFAALDGVRLAAYGWYALENVEGEHNFGVPMSFPSNVAYMYNGFTHEDYRGLRLHSRCIGLALKALQTMGVTRMLSTVDWQNHASLRSCDRLGSLRLGRIVTVGGEKGILLKSPSQGRQRGVRFGRSATQRPARPTRDVKAIAPCPARNADCVTTPEEVLSGSC